MHLTGTVKELDYRRYHDTTSPISLFVQFDRGCITSTMCSCRSSSKWCEHVIMLCIARIRGIVPCEIHPPMSEILSQFNRDQLQKLIQHFLEKVLPVGILPVLEIACQLKDKESEVNKQCGAPGKLEYIVIVGITTVYTHSNDIMCAHSLKYTNANEQFCLAQISLLEVVLVNSLNGR